MKVETAVHITDVAECENARMRLAVRTQKLLGVPSTFVSVRSEIEAAGELNDALAAGGCGRGFVFVNRAPRDGAGNGKPFGYCVVGETIVVSTTGGETFSLLYRAGGANSIRQFDVPTVMRWAVECSLVDEAEASWIEGNQFRSLWFVPLAAQWIREDRELPAKSRPFADFVPKPPFAVWRKDEPFGNLKTTLRPGDLEEARPRLLESLRCLPVHRRLSDVPSGTLSWVIGSSGLPGGNCLDGNRFLEIVKGNGNAAQELGLQTGSSLCS